MPHVQSFNPSVLVKNCTKQKTVTLRLNDWQPVESFLQEAASYFWPGEQLTAGELVTRLAAVPADQLAKIGCQGVCCDDECCHSPQVIDWDEYFGCGR